MKEQATLFSNLYRKPASLSEVKTKEELISKLHRGWSFLTTKKSDAPSGVITLLSFSLNVVVEDGLIVDTAVGICRHCLSQETINNAPYCSSCVAKMQQHENKEHSLSSQEERDSRKKVERILVQL